MDGVLVDSEPIHFEATRALLANHGVVYSPGRGENFFGFTDREVFRELKTRFALAATEAELADEWIERVVALLAAPLEPLPGVPGVVEELRRRDIRLALASSSAPAVIDATLAGLGLSTVFEFTVSGHDVSRGKPAPDIFIEAARRLDVPRTECLVVEDSHNGVRAASSAGMRCVVIPCGSTADQDFAGATARLASLAELPAWIRANAWR
jgi:HAD superfamily hydrolase (TIGR01509 family)